MSTTTSTPATPDGFDRRGVDAWARFQTGGLSPIPPDDSPDGGPDDGPPWHWHRPPHPPPPPVTLPEPEQTSPDKYGVVDGPDGNPAPVFDPTVTDLGADVIQGQVGDCYLAATVSEIAERRPDLIHNMITDNGDGTVTVHLFHRVDGELKPVDVRVDEELPVDHNGSAEFLYYGSSEPVGQTRDLWWPLIEKAYAKMVGGYDKLPQWPNDSAATALENLTGRSATGFGFPSDPRALANQLSGLLKSGKMVVVGTPDASWMEQHGIVPFHVYSVYGAGIDAQGPYVLLRNPWGEFEWGDSITSGGMNLNSKDGSEDGYFRIPASDFLKYFSGGDYVDPPAPPPVTTPAPSRGRYHIS